MAVQNRPPRIVDLDLDATAPLPVIDFDDDHTVDAPALPEPATATDVFPTPVVPAGVAELADSLREVEHRLQRKIERVGKLEVDLAAARLQTDGLRAQLEHAQRASAEREASLRAELAAAARRDADLQREFSSQQNILAEARAQLQTQQRANLLRNQERDLLELRRRCEQQHEALSTWQGFRAFSESLLAESEAQLRGVDARHLAALQEAQAQCSQLQDELAATRQQAATQIAALTESLREAGQAQQAGAAELQASADRVTQLSAELAAANERLHAAETQGRDSGERVHAPEPETHASATPPEDLQQDMQPPGRDDAGDQPALAPVIGEVVLRVLIRHDGGSDVVYPLGRRTSIGRTSDNDIQVDTTFISRHHAVLLSSPDHCIVEDLNSTNGVLVNGHRVGRQILHDGDTVTVGKTEFRYQQRS